MIYRGIFFFFFFETAINVFRSVIAEKCNGRSALRANVVLRLLISIEFLVANEIRTRRVTLHGM